MFIIEDKKKRKKTCQGLSFEGLTVFEQVITLLVLRGTEASLRRDFMFVSLNLVVIGEENRRN